MLTLRASKLIEPRARAKEQCVWLSLRFGLAPGLQCVAGCGAARSVGPYARRGNSPRLTDGSKLKELDCRLWQGPRSHISVCPLQTASDRVDGMGLPGSHSHCPECQGLPGRGHNCFLNFLSQTGGPPHSAQTSVLCVLLHQAPKIPRISPGPASCLVSCAVKSGIRIPQVFTECCLLDPLQAPPKVSGAGRVSRHCPKVSERWSARYRRIYFPASFTWEVWSPRARSLPLWERLAEAIVLLNVARAAPGAPGDCGFSCLRSVP